MLAGEHVAGTGEGAAVPAPTRRSPTTSAIPVGTVPLGTWSLESVYEPREYLADADGYAALAAANASSSERERPTVTRTRRKEPSNHRTGEAGTAHRTMTGSP